jgi:flagellar basal body-associated protein FliL
MEHDKQSEWEQTRPRSSRQGLYLILGVLAIVIILGSMCLYLVPLFTAGDSDSTSMLLHAALLSARV